MHIYLVRASNEKDATYFSRQRDAHEFARTKTGRSAVVVIERIKLRDLPPMKMALACLNGAGFEIEECRERVVTTHASTSKKPAPRTPRAEPAL